MPFKQAIGNNTYAAISRLCFVASLLCDLSPDHLDPFHYSYHVLFPAFLASRTSLPFPNSCPVCLTMTYFPWINNSSDLSCFSPLLSYLSLLFDLSCTFSDVSLCLSSCSDFFVSALWFVISLRLIFGALIMFFFSFFFFFRSRLIFSLIASSARMIFLCCWFLHWSSTLISIRAIMKWIILHNSRRWFWLFEIVFIFLVRDVLVLIIIRLMAD